MSSPKTQFYGASSLDGFLATRDDGIDWLLQFGDVPSSYAAFIAQVGAIAMGAATYEWLLPQAPRQAGPPGTATVALRAAHVGLHASRAARRVR